MNKDTIKGAAKDAAGSIKRAAGKAVGNDRLAAEGAADKAAGKMQKAFGKAKDAIHREVR